VHLILHAQDALPRGGHIQIAVGVVERLPPDVIPPPVASTGSWVSLRVQEDGEGMSVGVKGHAFEPSPTTSRPERVGLGLSAVHGIVQQNDGSIAIETVAGGGNAVTLFFPRLTQSPRAVEETSPDGSRFSARPTVLVVDEHAAIRSLVGRVLSPRGIHVIQAETGEDAIACSEHETIDVLLIDGHLDREDGSEVAQRLASRMPNLSVLYMTGGFVAEGSVAGISRASAISKPFDAETLVTAVQRALSARPVPS
jgi:CheY-like chemotaxis protein